MLNPNTPTDTLREPVPELRYLVAEEQFPHGHPEVVAWSEHFQAEARKAFVFANIETALAHRCPGPDAEVVAETMAAIWNCFTRHVPKFLSKAVAKTNDPEWQFYVIQVAYDELGGSDKDRRHSKLFGDAMVAAGIPVRAFPGDDSVGKLLVQLDETLEGITSQPSILGLLLAFEIIAQENIETLFQALCRDGESERRLSGDVFFVIHRADEVEHIRHSVANFLRFCPTEQQRVEFKEGFDEGINFWLRFWDQAACLFAREVARRRAPETSI